MEDTRNNMRNVICGGILVVVVILLLAYHSVQLRELSGIYTQKQGIMALVANLQKEELKKNTQKVVEATQEVGEYVVAEHDKEVARQAQIDAERKAALLASRGGRRIEMNLPNVDTSFKAYMDYRTITSTTSDQYKLQQGCWTDDQGLRRCGDDYCVALGSYYSTRIGDRFEITLDSGRVFTAVLSDVKSDVHTDASHMYRPTSGNAQNLVEFVVDTNRMPQNVRSSGTVCGAGFAGDVTKIVKLE